MVIALDMKVSQFMDKQVIVRFPVVDVVMPNIHGELVVLTGPVSAPEKIRPLVVRELDSLQRMVQHERSDLFNESLQTSLRRRQLVVWDDVVRRGGSC